MIGNMRVVDLTQPLDERTVMWPGAPRPTAETVLTIATTGSTTVSSRSASTAARISTRRATWWREPPASTRSTPPAWSGPWPSSTSAPTWRDSPDSVLTLEQVQAFEDRARRASPTARPSSCARAGRTSTRDAARYANAPGELRFPGFGPEAARFLVEERGAVGLGIDTLGIDPGVATDFVVHRQISHPRGVWHLEGLTNLAQLPPLGAWVVVGVLKLTDGSGGPARVFALVP